MSKFAALAFLSALILAAPAFADDTPSGVASDVGAVQKDNAAMAHDNSSLAKDRAAKAAAKANGDYGSQAVDSVKIGADKMMRGEKQNETQEDKNILNSDTNSAVSK